MADAIGLARVFCLFVLAASGKRSPLNEVEADEDGGTWILHRGLNCFKGHGGDYLPGAYSLPRIATAKDCRATCKHHKLCEGILIKNSYCSLRRNLNVSLCVQSRSRELWLYAARARDKSRPPGGRREAMVADHPPDDEEEAVLQYTAYRDSLHQEAMADPGATATPSQEDSLSPWKKQSVGTGCTNWWEIQIDRHLAGTFPNASACGLLCKENPHCVGFAFQARQECTYGDSARGACSLWNGTCSPHPNACWDDYVMLHRISSTSSTAKSEEATPTTSTSSGPEAPSSPASKATKWRPAAWRLRAGGMGCSNWLSIEVGKESEGVVANLSACGELCWLMPSCIGFGYQARATSTCTSGNSVPGSCALWNSTCESKVNSCWDDYEMESSLHETVVPEPVQREGRRNAQNIARPAAWRLRAGGMGCSNWLSIEVGKESGGVVANLSACGELCRLLPSCIGFGYQARATSTCTSGNSVPGSCALWNSTCVSKLNSCWDDYEMESSLHETGVPEPVQREGRRNAQIARNNPSTANTAEGMREDEVSETSRLHTSTTPDPGPPKHGKAYTCDKFCPLSPGEGNVAEFRCLDGTCLDIKNYCNGISDCADGSDESSCSGWKKDQPDPFNCTTASANGADAGMDAWSKDKRAWCCQHRLVGCAGGCDAACMASGLLATCQERVGWSSKKLFGKNTEVGLKETDACVSAHRLVMLECDSCWLCSVSEACGAKALTWTTTLTTTLSSTATTTRTTTLTTTTTATRTTTSATTTVTRTSTSATTTTTPTTTSTITTTTLTTTSATTTTGTQTTASTTMTTTLTTSSTTSLSTTTAATLKPYDCQAGLDDWDNWELDKKAWCCLHYSVRCPRTHLNDNTDNSDVVQVRRQAAIPMSPSTTTWLGGDQAAAVVECSVKNIAFMPLDMHGHALKRVKNEAECQGRCASTAGCAHYSYWAPRRHCHIQSDKSIAEPSALFKAGPPSCAQEDGNPPLVFDWYHHHEKQTGDPSILRTLRTSERDTQRAELVERKFQDRQDSFLLDALTGRPSLWLWLFIGSLASIAALSTSRFLQSKIGSHSETSQYQGVDDLGITARNSLIGSVRRTGILSREASELFVRENSDARTFSLLNTSPTEGINSEALRDEVDDD